MLCNNISSATNFSPTKAHFGFTKPIFIMSSLINAVNVKKDLAYHSNSNKLQLFNLIMTTTLQLSFEVEVSGK